jgi:hypothetical protein
MHEIAISERFSYLSSTSSSQSAVYYLRGDTQISILPTSATGTVTLFYVPVISALSDPTDTFNGRFGWEEYVYAWVGLKYMRRMNDETKVWERSLEKIESRIRTQIANMNLSEPRKARNIEPQLIAEANNSLWTT